MPHLMLALYVRARSAQLDIVDHLDDRIDDHRRLRTDATSRRLSGDRGQATTEYALVLLAAAMVALLVIAWASAGGGAAKISALFNKVIDAVISRV